jgi:hypothetical protein
MEREVQERFGRLEELILDLRAEVSNINSSLFEFAFVAPDKPREGMIRFADGTSWNPGAGLGLYQYQGGAWVNL